MYQTRVSKIYLPRHFGGEIVDEQPVLGPRGRAVLVDPSGAIAAAASSAVSIAPLASTIATSSGGASSVFDGHAFSEEFFAVQFIHGVFGIAIIVEFLKC